MTLSASKCLLYGAVVMVVLYHLWNDYSSSSRVSTLPLRKYIPLADDLAEADDVASEENLERVGASKDNVDEMKVLHKKDAAAEDDKKIRDSVMKFVKSTKALVAEVVEGVGGSNNNDRVSIPKTSGEILPTTRKQKIQTEVMEPKTQLQNKTNNWDTAQKKAAPLIKKKARNKVSKLSSVTRLKTTYLNASWASKHRMKENIRKSQVHFKKVEGDSSNIHKKEIKRLYKQKGKVIFPHSFDKLEANDECRPKKLNDKPYAYKPKPNPWETKDVNNKSTGYLREIISPYSNVSKTDIDRWGRDCHKKCRYFECSTARTGIDDTLKVVLKEWMKLTSATGELNILTINAFGSLVASLWRGNYLMQWDTDFDYLIWSHDTEKLEQFMDEYNARKDNPFKLSVQPDWRCKFDEYDDGNWGGRRYYNAKGKKVKVGSKSDGHSGVANYVAPNARLIHKESGWYVDIWPMYADNHSAVGSAKYERTAMTVTFNDINYRYVANPRNQIFPLQQCFLGNVPTWCPADGARAMERYFHVNRVSLAVPDHYLDYDTGCWVKKKRL